MAEPNGYGYSKYRTITTGLPRGGVLSPCLRLAFPNQVVGKLKQSRDLDQLKGKGYTDVILADDIAILISAESQAGLQLAAHRNAEYFRMILKGMLLQLSIQKCRNAAYSPAFLLVGILRRSRKVRYSSTVYRLRKQQKAEARFLTEPIEFEPFGERVEDPTSEKCGYPLPITETIKILGVEIDSQFKLDEHFKSMITKAAVRECIPAKVANCHWELEVGVMHITHNAVINSMLRYALVVTGSTSPPDLVRRVDTQVINVAARKIGGISRTARIESLHFIMNAMTSMSRSGRYSWMAV